MVLAEFETSGGYIGCGAYPLIVCKNHVDITAPGVEVSDEAPDSSVGNRDGKGIEVEDDLVETGIEGDVVTAGFRCKRLAEFSHGSTVVLSPVGILTEFEATGRSDVDITCPGVSVLGHGLVSTP